MERLCERTLWQMGLIVIALCVGCSWERASNVSEDQIQWGSETRDYLSYEEYFSQQRLYDYAEDVFSGWSLQDADISYDGTVLRLTDSKGIPMQDIATLKGYLFQTADKNWIYGISETSELVRVSYSGKIETLFADRTGLLRSLAEKEHAPIYLADGCTLFFLAGTDEGIGIYRLYLPNKQADVLYSSIPRNALRLRLEPPPSNVEAVWDNGDVLFFARYEELLNTSSGYAPETMGEDECIGMLELDEKLYSAQAHYINALTGDYREMPYGYVYIQLRRIYGINSKSKNNENRILHYMREEYKLTEADRNASFIFLLDGFNEIPTTTMQIRCLRDILDISDKKYPEAAIILSNRDPLDTYMDLLEYENGFDADQIDRLKFYFHNCYIKELSQEQIDDYFEPNQRCLVPAARNILDTPFYLVLYRQAMQPSGKDAGRWITDAFQDHLNNGTPEKTTLMLQMLLREIDNLRSDITSAERELRCFILTKVLPYLGYQMALSSHLDPALTPIKSPNFFRRDAYARTYACLSAYLPTIDIWNEYKNQNPETLEKPWNTLRKLYQDSNPDISDLTAAIPYTVFPSGLLCHHGRNISFCHDNYRDFFAAFHIANVVYGLYSGIDLAALSPDAQEVFLLQLETLDNSILFDAISILRQYFGLSIYDISAQDTTDLSDTCAQIALPAILIRLLDAVIRRGELSKNEHSQLCQLRSTLCERFVLSFKALDESDPLQTKYCLFFSLALSMLARDYRTGVAGTRDLIKCAGYAQQCINGEKKLNIPKADGYLQVALCLNARMEDMLNVTDTKMNGTLPFSSQLADAVREAVRDYHEGSMYKRDEAVRTFRRNLFPRWKPGLGNVLACCDIFQIILEAAYEKYVSAANQNNQNYQEIARLGYVSKAYLVLAAIGTSGGALNLLAQMLINQANQYEADQRISFFRRHPDIDTFVQQHAAPYGWPLNDNYALAYRVLQSVCGIQRGSQPYSHMKKAELVLKGYVSESSSTQLTSLNIAINGGLAMGHYWKGRLLLEQAKQDHDRCNDYKDAAIASFCATNVTERFDHLPENADEDAAPQLSPPQWLSAIELLRYPDRAVFRVDRRMVFQTIYQKLTQQVEEVQSDNIQIHNERYRLTKKDVRSNLERCLDMVKAQFPDKEPLIQKMIRSIR